MIKLNVLEDETLLEPLNRLISSMLPHEQYQPELALDVLVHLEKYIKIEELTMEYYVLLSTIRELLKIRTAKKGFRTALTRDVFDSIITYNLGDLVRSENVGMEEWLHSNGLPNQLAIESTYQLACQKLYERSLNLYEVCYALGQATVDALNFVPALKAAYVRHVGEQLIRSQAMILNTSLRDGRKVLSGSESWLKFTLEKLTALKGRLDSGDDEGYTIDSVAKSKEMLDRLQAMLQPVAQWEIPPLDDTLPICKHRLIVLAANEHVGKTTISINLATNALRAGSKVLIMAGENSEEALWAKILSNYIYKEFGVFITENHIANKDSMEIPEDKLKLLSIAQSSLASQGNLTIVPRFSYENLHTELVSQYEKREFDLLLIDHTLALKGQGSEFEKVSNLAVDLREFKKDYPVACVVLSHLSSTARDALTSGKQVTQSPTRGSAILSNEADEIYVLFKNDILEKQGLLGLQQYKRRNAPPLEDYIILKKKFNVQSYEWDEQFQNNYGEDTISTEMAVQNLAKVYEGDEDYDDLEDDDDYDDFYDDEME